MPANRYRLRVRKPAQPEEPGDDFATYLHDAMRGAGFTKPTYLARAADIDPSVVIRWLRSGQRPSVPLLERIAPVLGVPVAELIRVAYPSTTTETPPAEPPDRYLDPVTKEEYTHPDERELWGLRRLEEADRRELIYYLRAKRMAREAEQPRRRRAG